MRAYTLTHLSNHDLLRDLAALIKQDRATTAALLAHIAEVDARRLYLPAGYPSIYEYCVQELRMSEQAALKRLRAGRTARRFPTIFAALADGRLHLSAVVLLTPYLTPDSADELLAAAAHRTKCEIEQLLAQRLPRPDVPARLQVLRHAQSLLSHRIPSGDIAQVLDRALDALIGQLEKQKFAATNRPQTGSRRSTTAKRHVPARVKRAVWERDQGQCTFTSTTGHRCAARTLLEFDHIDPVARGGEATVKSMRLRCRAHNQYEAECTFGSGFMSDKREAARRAVREPLARAPY